ncbi:GlsB/YeaQ/YmgE family stress response membrane protein [Crocinitomicaceae bacterium]|nr:GlsB/YeaQ/YmgE family stress response membrane protein [Crocinitomicaceae bacterium]|tara:strand:+ start:309 stop:557 length:249 start_codon:yes stop_codon:yes gene_type:complete
MSVLIPILIGAFAGWLASKIMNAKSSRVLLNIILGIIGGHLGNWIFNALNISIDSDWLGSIITSTLGAIILIWGFRFLFKKK